MIKVAKSSLQNRDEEISHAYSKIEDQLTYLGVTAVEDRLQDGVPETITALREAGIQVCVPKHFSKFGLIFNFTDCDNPS